MRVLIACEFSGVVREAFREKGHDAWSCDLLAAEDGSKYHFKNGVRELMDPRLNWDLMIAHPPCTYLCNSGVRWLYGKGKSQGASRDPVRWGQMEEAATFFKMLWDCSIPKVCIENPIMHGYGRKLIGVDPLQMIQPWMFGHGEIKSTCLWLRGLPLLMPTEIVAGRTARVHCQSPGPDRWKERSRTLTGIAKAMAEQWT